MPRKSKNVENVEVKEVKRRKKLQYSVYVVYLENQSTNELFTIKLIAYSEKDAIGRAKLIVDDNNVDVVTVKDQGLFTIPDSVIDDALATNVISDLTRNAIITILKDVNVLKGDL